MKIDFDKTDGLITLVAHKRIGLWGSQLLLRGSRVGRTGGRLPHASAGSLLSVALLNTLNSISRNQVSKLAPTSGRLRLTLLTSDAAFADGINAMAQSSDAAMLRSGKNFTAALARKFDRFDITAVMPEGGDKSVLVLGNWLSVNAFDRSKLNDLPPWLGPTVMSQVL